MFRTLALVLSLYSNDPNAVTGKESAAVRADAPHEQVEHIWVYGRRLRAEATQVKETAPACTAKNAC
jgi:hypothetical protein